MPPSRYASNIIRNEKSSHRVHRGQTPKLVSLLPTLLFPRGRTFFRGGRHFLAPFWPDSAPDENIAAPLKIESAPEEKHPGHASGWMLSIISDISKEFAYQTALIQPFNTCFYVAIKQIQEGNLY